MKNIIIILMLPMAVLPPSGPWNTAATLAATSGAEVPMATMVRPITRGGTPNRWARPTAPLTNKSAHFQRSSSPARRHNTGQMISMC